MRIVDCLSTIVRNQLLDLVPKLLGWAFQQHATTVVASVTQLVLTDQGPDLIDDRIAFDSVKIDHHCGRQKSVVHERDPVNVCLFPTT